MKKAIIVLSIALTLFLIGYFVGSNAFVKKNVASVIIKNHSDHSIMTATIDHETGSEITANIKKGHSQRTRFITRGANSYSIKITFDDNRTIYSDTDRVIKNGGITIETVTDSGIVYTPDK